MCGAYVNKSREYSDFFYWTLDCLVNIRRKNGAVSGCLSLTHWYFKANHCSLFAWFGPIRLLTEHFSLLGWRYSTSAQLCLWCVVSAKSRIQRVRIDNSTFERVEEFKYLGTTSTHQNSITEEIKSRFRSGNACYHSVQKLLSSRLLSKNLKIKIYRTIILPVFCLGVKLGRWYCGRKGS